MDALNEVISRADSFVWNNILLFVLVGTGIFFTIRTRFVQIRRFPGAWKRVFGNFSLNGGKGGKEGMSSFQALATAIAAQVGTGNIAGCATALVGGGPGAIFWMWLAAFFGMATIYGEAVRAGLLHPQGVQRKRRKVPGCVFRRHDHSFARAHGQYGPVQFDQ